MTTDDDYLSSYMERRMETLGGHLELRYKKELALINRLKPLFLVQLKHLWEVGAIGYVGGETNWEDTLKLIETTNKWLGQFDGEPCDSWVLAYRKLLEMERDSHAWLRA